MSSDVANDGSTPVEVDTSGKCFECGAELTPVCPVCNDLDGCNAEIVGMLREAAHRVFGGNCAFADDDLALLEHMAQRAADAGLTDGLSPDVRRHTETPHDRKVEARPGKPWAELIARVTGTVTVDADGKEVADFGTPSGAPYAQDEAEGTTSGTNPNPPSLAPERAP